MTADKNLERLCFLLIGLVATWLVVIIFTEIGLTTTQAGLYFVMPTALVLSVGMIAALIKRNINERHREVSLALMNLTWDAGDKLSDE